MILCVRCLMAVTLSCKLLTAEPLVPTAMAPVLGAGRDVSVNVISVLVSHFVPWLAKVAGSMQVPCPHWVPAMLISKGPCISANQQIPLQNQMIYLLEPLVHKTSYGHQKNTRILSNITDTTDKSSSLKHVRRYHLFNLKTDQVPNNQCAFPLTWRWESTLWYFWYDMFERL